MPVHHHTHGGSGGGGGLSNEETLIQLKAIQEQNNAFTVGQAYVQQANEHTNTAAGTISQDAAEKGELGQKVGQISKKNESAETSGID